MRRLSVLLIALPLSLWLAAAPASAADKVTISGRAYVFNHMDQGIAGATIRVRELPKLSATTDAAGDYSLKVPDDATITPYIEPPDGYNQIDLQTFRTRGKNIVNANFQTPADLEYNALAALLGVSFGPDGRPTDCVIVSTASARDVRGVDFATFTARTPHGVAGATAKEFPAIEGPTYFNDSVIPDPTQMSTSGDGGMIWTAVPAGTYRIATTSPTTRFAGFLATCAPGRVVNANPPWGAYELSPGEKPLAAGVAIVHVQSPHISRPPHGRPYFRVKFTTDEEVRAEMTLTSGGKTLGTKILNRVNGGRSVIAVPFKKSAGPKLKAQLTFTDRSGGQAKYVLKKRVKN